MRKGEILSLKWEQIRNGFIYLHKTKTNESRQIPINDALEKLFADMRKEQGPGANHVFTFAKGEHKLVGESPVRGRKGLAPVPDRISSVRTAFASALRRAGIEDFRFHDLRHTFASHLVMRGVSIKAVQELLGHKNIQMTMRYAHLSQEHKKEAVNALNGLTTSSTPATVSCHKMSQIRVVTPSASA